MFSVGEMMGPLEYIHVLISKICEHYLIWEKGVFGCDGGP